MTSHDVIPDREQLRAEAERRTRRGWWFVAVVVALLVLGPTAVLMAGGARVTGGEALVVFLPAIVGIVAGAVVLRRLRRHDHGRNLVDGAGRETRRAGRRALRTGHAPDARIDALARELAARTVRNSWLLVLYGVLLVIQLVLLTGRIVSGDDVDDILLSAGIAALWATNVVLLLISRNRSRRYLRRG